MTHANDNGDTVPFQLRMEAPWTLVKLKHWVRLSIAVHQQMAKEPDAERYRHHLPRFKALLRALDQVPIDFDPSEVTRA